MATVSLPKSDTPFTSVTAMLDTGALTTDEFALWCETSTTIDLLDPDHADALQAYLTVEQRRTIGQRRRAIAEAAQTAALKAAQSSRQGRAKADDYTISDKGLLSVNNLSTHKSDSFAPNFRPRVLDAFLRRLPETLRYIVAHAGDTIPADATMDGDYTLAVHALQKIHGESGYALRSAVKAAGITQWRETVPHIRAGKTAMDFDGCDSSKFVELCQQLLAKLA